MMLNVLYNLLILATVFAGVASVCLLANENQNSVLHRTVHAVRCGLHSRVRADHCPPKSGVYMSP